MEGYITTKEAAKKWGISQRQVQKHCKEGRIPGVVSAGKSYLIPVGASRPMYGFYSLSEVAKAKED